MKGPSQLEAGDGEQSGDGMEKGQKVLHEETTLNNHFEVGREEAILNESNIQHDKTADCASRESSPNTQHSSVDRNGINIL